MDASTMDDSKTMTVHGDILNYQYFLIIFIDDTPNIFYIIVNGADKIFNFNWILIKQLMYRSSVHQLNRIIHIIWIINNKI